MPVLEQQSKSAAMKVALGALFNYLEARAIAKFTAVIQVTMMYVSHNVN